MEEYLLQFSLSSRLLPKHEEIQICKALMLPVVLYGYEI
jgi:hypothetical protein